MTQTALFKTPSPKSMKYNWDSFLTFKKDKLDIVSIVHKIVENRKISLIVNFKLTSLNEK